MKVSILPDALKAALDVAAKPVNPRSVLPVLAYVLLEASPDGGLTVSGTDLRTRAWRTVAARVDEAGAVCLPPKALADFVANVPGADAITLTTTDTHKATLRCGSAEIRVPGFSGEDFPPGLDFADAAFDLTMAAPLFSELVESVAHAVAPDDSRAVLAGVLLQIVSGRLTLVAADGFRLARRSIDIEDAPDLSVIVSGKAVANAGRAVSAATSVRLSVDGNRSALLIDSEVGCWSIALIDGQFPDFNRVIPRNPPLALSVDRGQLLAAIALAQPVAREASGLLRLSVEGESLAVRARTPDGDQAAETLIPVEVLRGTPHPHGVNVTYLRQAVEAFSGDRVQLDIAGPASPCNVHDGDPGGNIQVVMAMHNARGG